MPWKGIGGDVQALCVRAKELAQGALVGTRPDPNRIAVHQAEDRAFVQQPNVTVRVHQQVQGFAHATHGEGIGRDVTFFGRLGRGRAADHDAGGKGQQVNAPEHSVK